MSQITNPTFGLLIAYLIPGFLTLAGLSPHSQTIQAWLGTAQAQAPAVGGFLYVTVASVAAGLTTSTIRWLILDHLHAHTGLPPPTLDFSKLQQNIDAFHAAVDLHYRYYQFYSNSIVAILIVTLGRWPFSHLAPDLPRYTLALGLVLLLALFFVASRDTLRKYYARLATLHEPASNEGELTDDQRILSNHKNDAQETWQNSSGSDSGLSR